jgi:hypothetical protein
MMTIGKSNIYSFTFLLAYLWTTDIAFCQDADRSVLSNSIAVRMPIGFKRMSEEMLSFKYVSGNIPTEVYTNDDGTINVVFKQANQLLLERNGVAVGKKLAQELAEKSHIQLLSSATVKSGVGDIYIFSFYSAGVDSKIYNVMSILSICEKLTVVSFNCIEPFQKQWQSSAFGIIKSIRRINSGKQPRR